MSLASQDLFRRELTARSAVNLSYPGAHLDHGSGGPNKIRPISQILSFSSDKVINAANLAV